MSTLNVSPLPTAVSKVTQMPDFRVFITDSRGDMLWTLDELKRVYPRIYNTIMKQYVNKELSFSRNNVNIYLVTMYSGTGRTSN